MYDLYLDMKVVRRCSVRLSRETEGERIKQKAMGFSARGGSRGGGGSRVMWDVGPAVPASGCVAKSMNLLMLLGTRNRSSWADGAKDRAQSRKKEIPKRTEAGQCRPYKNGKNKCTVAPNVRLGR